MVNYGRPIYTTKHIRTSVVIDNADTAFITYTVDSGGRLTYLHDPSNLMNVSYITYECE
jgi:hypothetical protein